jgi:hypothetical protein
MNNNQSGGYFIVIPQKVYGMTNLSPRAMLVFGAILSLSNGKNGYCYAANAYISDLMNVSERTVSGCIAELKKMDLIKVEVGMNKETRTLYRRITTFWTKSEQQKATTQKGASLKTKSIEPEWFQDYLNELEEEEKRA